MKKFNFFLFLFILSTISFAKPLVVTKYRMNNNPGQLVVEFQTSSKPNYEVNYDSLHRVLFIEFYNTKSVTSVTKKLLKNFQSNKYIKKITTRRYKNSVGVFIYFNKNVHYSTRFLRSPGRFVLGFNQNKGNKDYTIVVDAGHGGKDPGATGFNKYHEKDLALQIALKVGKALEKDFNVIYTRKDDRFIPLSGRPNMGNRKKADFFVSIHLNANLNTAIHGADVFYFSRTESNYAKKISSYENSFASISGEKSSSIKLISGQTIYKQNKVISAEIAKDLIGPYAKKMGFLNRGYHGANFAVLRGFDGPGLLVEVGFVTNAKDLKKLRSSKYQSIAANEIAKAIKSHFYK